VVQVAPIQVAAVEVVQVIKVLLDVVVMEVQE
jgi:hypothetical protein